jgi:NAD-dependent dihydropyrimidine dehydrogenase PreA subunit
MFGPVLYDAFRQIKRTFDPDNIFNPGKIVNAPPLTSNLRYGPSYRTQQPETFFDYASYGGMAGAVEMCSGLGVCRKTIDGTMCPSYMATREEAHSTRGRANALRMVMAGELEEAGLGGESVRQVLDLCLECRACTAECPVGVDVARFKSDLKRARRQCAGALAERTPARRRPPAHATGVGRSDVCTAVQRASAGERCIDRGVQRYVHELLQSPGRDGGSTRARSAWLRR